MCCKFMVQNQLIARFFVDLLTFADYNYRMVQAPARQFPFYSEGCIRASCCIFKEEL
jgi:hypothetical protein